MDLKRLFFALEIAAPWPEELPRGRILAPHDRHLTLAFIREANEAALQKLLPDFPKPPFRLGLSGFFDKALFLPHREPRVAAWNVKWLEEQEHFYSYQKEICDWLKKVDHEPLGLVDFLAHVTIARSPFNVREWEDAFEKLPFYASGIGLYESLGHSAYKTCWILPISAPFEEIEHTADLAFLVHGVDLEQIHLHAQLAMSFHFPSLLDYFRLNGTFTALNEVVSSLNQMIAQADAEKGCPFKAVSFHGEFKDKQWEMIVDV